MLYPNGGGRVAYWTDMTPLELAKHFSHQETVDFFEQYEHSMNLFALNIWSL